MSDKEVRERIEDLRNRLANNYKDEEIMRFVEALDVALDKFKFDANRMTDSENRAYYGIFG